MKNRLSRFAVPYVVWMAIVVVAPILIMVVYAFSSAQGGFTLENFSQMGTYTAVFTRSFKLAIVATLICLIIGYPTACFMSREGPSFQRVGMVLIMLPMWMNFLLRTYSWMSILENNGLLNQLFQKMGIISVPPPSILLMAKVDTEGTNTMVMPERTPGRLNGRMTRRNTLKVSAPRSWAASMRERSSLIMTE